MVYSFFLFFPFSSVFNFLIILPNLCIIAFHTAYPKIKKSASGLSENHEYIINLISELNSEKDNHLKQLHEKSKIKPTFNRIIQIIYAKKLINLYSSVN